LIKLDKRIRMAQRNIKRLEKEAGNSYEELKIIVERRSTTARSRPTRPR
jgi:hypothetical protein